VNYPPDVNKVGYVTGPAGGIISNLEDMKSWVQLMIDGGVTKDGKTLLSKESLAWIISPHMSNPINYASFFPEPMYPQSFYSSHYAHGWFIGSYRGRPIIYHGGNVFGQSSLVGFLPIEKIGFVILTNADGLYFPPLEIAFVGLDVATGETPWLPTKYSCTFPCPYFPGCDVPPQHIEVGSVHEKKMNKGRKPKNIVGRDINEYAGTYHHPSYGTVSIFTNSSKSEDTLFFQYGNLVGSGKMDEDVEDRCTLEVTTPVSLVPSSLVLLFGRNLVQGTVDTLYVPFSYYGPPTAFTSVDYVPRTSGYPKYTPSALA